MTHILHITASAHGDTSSSRAATSQQVAGLLAAHPGATITTRDLARTPLPQIDGA